MPFGAVILFIILQVVGAGLDTVIERQAAGRRRVLSIRDSERIIQLLITYRQSFIDDMVNRFIDVWLRF